MKVLNVFDQVLSEIAPLPFRFCTAKSQELHHLTCHARGAHLPAFP